MRIIHRYFLICLISIGILLPKVGTALSMALSDDVQTIVICSGDGIKTIRLGPDGTPLPDGEEELTESPCLLGNILLPEAADMPYWRALSYEYESKAGLYVSVVVAEKRYVKRRPARAPPVLIV